MSNQNTVAGFYNIPAQVITVSTEVALLVPAAGVYAGLPSPVLPAASGLSASPSPDITGIGSTLDVHRFNVRLTGKVANPGGGNLALRLYQVPFANVGVISAAGSVTSAGAPGSGDVILVTFTSITAPANPSTFSVEADLVWSSSVNRIDGYFFGNANGVFMDFAEVTAVTSGVATANQLNFLPSFQFSVANATNSVQLSEFVVERV
jgi:hypothetical protein